MRDGNKMKTVDEHKKHGPLPFFEISLYWVLWISLSSYSMYSIFKASQGKGIKVHYLHFSFVASRVFKTDS